MKNIRLLVDTNVIMDFIVKRNPFSNDAEKVIELCMQKNVKGCIAAHGVVKI